MTTLFLPGYPQDIEVGAGHNPLPGKRKVILHRTESGRGSGKNVRNSWRGSSNWAKGLSHFIADGPIYTQLLPLNTCAYTSVGGPDAANKTGCPIQVEITGWSREDFTDEEYETLSKWLADLKRAGVDLSLDDEDSHPRFYGEDAGFTLATESSPIRNYNQWGGFANYNGVTAHQFLRGNSHWDVGKKDIARILRRARQFLAGAGGGDWLDMATKEEVKQLVAEAIGEATSVLANKPYGNGEWATYECYSATGEAFWCSPDRVQASTYLGRKHIGNANKYWWSRFKAVDGPAKD